MLHKLYLKLSWNRPLLAESETFVDKWFFPLGGPKPAPPSSAAPKP